MNIVPNRRAVLLGAVASAVGFVAPVRAATPQAERGDAAALIASHKAALAELSAAYEAEEEASAAYYADTDANPVTVELPGLKFLPNGTRHVGGKVRFAVVNARQISEERIQELYQHYEFYSQRGGYRFADGAMVKIDLSADQARDETAALANFAAASDQLRAVADATGKTVADQRVANAVVAAEEAWLSALAHSPQSEEEAVAKRDYLAERLESDALDFGHDQLAALISSLARQG